MYNIRRKIQVHRQEDYMYNIGRKIQVHRKEDICYMYNIGR